MFPRWLSSTFGLMLLVGSPTAQALEVQFEGEYRMRGRLFDTLSLDRAAASSEGLAWYVQHRLWLRPKFLISDKVAVFADLKGLDNVHWGDEPHSQLDFATGEAVPTVFTDQLTAPTSETDPQSPLLDFTIWRAWGEVHTPVGRFAFGRMPVHWGMGLWQNDGLGPSADYGDTVDRLMWEYVVQSVYVGLAADINTEGFINETDDTTSFNAHVAYRNEQIQFGVLGQYRVTPSLDLDVFTIDLATAVELGPLDVELEFVGQFGGGDLGDGRNDVNILAFGGALDAHVRLKTISLGLGGGFATGDGDPNDERIKAFAFDRDFNTSLILFEQPMPVFTAGVPTEANAGRDTELVQLGDRISNAVYLRPEFTYHTPVEGLDAEVAMLAARAAKNPESAEDRNGYGVEFDVTARYTGIEHFDVSGTFGVYLPGQIFKNYSDEIFTDGWSAPVYAGQLNASIRF